MKQKYNWNQLKTEYVTGDISIAALAKKHNANKHTLYRESIIEKCADNAAYLAAITLYKELDIANRLADVLHGAAMDEKQFNRFLVKGKDFTDEVILDKVDMDSLNNALKALKSLEEIKLAMNQAISSKDTKSEERQETGVVMLPDIEEENNEKNNTYKYFNLSIRYSNQTNSYKHHDRASKYFYY